MAAAELVQKLHSQFPDLLNAPVEFRGEWTAMVRDSRRIVEVCQFLKSTLQVDYLVDIASLDHYGEEPRFTLVYELYSYTHLCHLRLKTQVSEDLGTVPSVVSVWAGAAWLEREVFDMMGIRFGGHPDLRRVLMWEGYPYFPLRKDFPLAGKTSDVPEVAFTHPAPLEGGPFVTVPGGKEASDREPRVKTV